MSIGKALLAAGKLAGKQLLVEIGREVATEAASRIVKSATEAPRSSERHNESPAPEQEATS